MANPRLSLIDDSSRGDHHHLTPADNCYYLYEYTSGRNYSFSVTNNLISNLKKKPSQSGQPGYSYKARAIRSSAAALAQALNAGWLASATLVPVPGSKAAGHPDADDRMVRICRLMSNPAPDVRALVTQAESTTASHEAGRPVPPAKRRHRQPDRRQRRSPAERNIRQAGSGGVPRQAP